MAGKFRDAMKAAKAVKTQQAEDTAIQQSVNTDLQQSVNTDDDPLVSLTIKVPLSKRNHWQVEAKRQRTTVTEAIVTALENRFGQPNTHQ